MWALLCLLFLLAAPSHCRGLRGAGLLGRAANQGCPANNPRMAAALKIRIQNADTDPFLPQSKTFEDFVLEVKNSLERHVLPVRAIQYVFQEGSDFNPTCNSGWMEFGVFRGDTINLAARFRTEHCGLLCPPVFGFDTFTGLPEAWDRDGTNRTIQQGIFSVGGHYPKVGSNVELFKGLFNESLPIFLKDQRRLAGNLTLGYLHIDCDLYGGAHDALMLLKDSIRVGTVLLFDELVNYARFRDGEIKALWEYLQVTGTKLATIGISGPLPGKDYAVDLDIKEGERPWFHQSAAFVVVSQPGS